LTQIEVYKAAAARIGETMGAGPMEQNGISAKMAGAFRSPENAGVAVAIEGVPLGQVRQIEFSKLIKLELERSSVERGLARSPDAKLAKLSQFKDMSLTPEGIKAYLDLTVQDLLKQLPTLQKSQHDAVALVETLSK
jgi:hypothetical protein